MASNGHNSEGYVPGDIKPIATRPMQTQNAPPCYLPQQTDLIPGKELGMETIGPWATGQVDWTPLAGMTGTRPVVDKYSITRYSTGEWRQHNSEILAGEPIRNAERLETGARNCLVQAFATSDKEFNDNTERLRERSQDIYRWRAETEFAIKALAEEILTLEEQRQRVKSACSVLMLPESIARECLDLRSNRLEPDLVRDTAEEELIKEMSLIGEIRRLFNKALNEIDMQMVNNKAAKARAEFDWSDKNISYETDSINASLSSKSTNVLFKPASVRVTDKQSSVGYWEHFCKENLEQVEAMRQHSINLRGSVETLLTNTARDLRTQADRVDQTLSEKAACTDELRIRLEEELKMTLQKLTDIENLCNDIKKALRQMDLAMKVAQTRLDNRSISGRPNVEQCRDAPQHGLIEEVKAIADCVSSLKDKLRNANTVRSELLKSRGDLERELTVKKKSLSIDRDRCGTVRLFYPSASKLSGHD